MEGGLRLRVRLPDYPGSLEGLTATDPKASANIVGDVDTTAPHYGVGLNRGGVGRDHNEKGREHASELLAALSGSRYEFSVRRRADRYVSSATTPAPVPCKALPSTGGPFGGIWRCRTSQ